MATHLSRSPIKDKPLPLPGQSVQDAIDTLLWDEIAPYVTFAVALLLLAGFEWFSVLRHLPPQPWLYSVLAVLACAFAAAKMWRVRIRVQRLKLGRDGERVVGQYLERLRADGADVFHDVPGEGFNIDHVVLSAHGFYAIETKTRSKPVHGNPRVVLTESGIVVNGFRPDRDPVIQAQAGARWLAHLLEESTGKQFPVHGVVLYPGWFVEPMPEAWRKSPDRPWVLEPKALPTFIEHEPTRITESDCKLAAYHLSRYIRMTIAA
ncbi:MAG: nuclease-related domain-containing protein [Steroidobacteraceae bacterium]